jgi:hypothetical protein
MSDPKAPPPAPGTEPGPADAATPAAPEPAAEPATTPPPSPVDAARRAVAEAAARAAVDQVAATLGRIADDALGTLERRILGDSDALTAAGTDPLDRLRDTYAKETAAAAKVDRAAERAAGEARAREQLAELKRKMGK